MAKRLVRIDEAGNKTAELATYSSPWKEIEAYLKGLFNNSSSFTFSGPDGKFTFQLEDAPEYAVKRNGIVVRIESDYEIAVQAATDELKRQKTNLPVTVSIGKVSINAIPSN
jgi:hypothetical protein